LNFHKANLEKYEDSSWETVHVFKRYLTVIREIKYEFNNKNDFR